MRSVLRSLLVFVFFGLSIFVGASSVQAQATCANTDKVTVDCCKQGAFYYANFVACNKITGYTYSGRGVPPEAARLQQAEVLNKQKQQASLEVHANDVIKSTLAALYLLTVPNGQALTSTGAVVPFVGAPPKEMTILSYQPGALGALSDATQQIAILPVNTREYVNYVASNINPLGAQPAYAQGLGFSSLTPVLGLWRIFRNLAYFFFVVIFIVIGFLIMFRSKIGGQAAVTVQQALPKIVVALLLVTFSYAIAGLMIDLMYLIIYLMIGIFTVSGVTDLSSANLSNIAFSESIFSNMLRLVTSGTTVSIAGHIGTLVQTTLEEAQLGTVLAAFGGVTANIVFSLVLLIALLVNLFRVFFLLLQAYVMVIFSVVFAPIQLLLGALPGQNTFSAWLKGLWENLLVFPVVIFLVFCATYFSKAPNAFGAQAPSGNYFTDSLPTAEFTSQVQAEGFAAPQLGLHAGVSGEVIRAFLLFGIIAMIPKAVEIAKGLASGKINVDVGKAVGELWKQGKGSALTKAALFSPLTVPAAGVGAFAGYKYATDRANKLGLQGGARTLAQAGGILGGGAVGLNLPGTIKHVVPASLRQIAQTQITESSKEIRQAAESRRSEAESRRQEAMIAEQRKLQQSQASTPPPAPVGAKSKSMNEMRKQ